jgi:hypothetical protein
MIDVPATILPAVLPAIIDGLKGIFQRLFGGTKPISVDEQIKLMSAETEKLKALAEIDKVYGEPSKWVIDLRSSFRYIACGFLLLLSLISIILYLITPSDYNHAVKQADMYEITKAFIQIDASTFFFLFGDRVYINLKKR